MYRIGQEEIDAVARVIRSGDLFKVNGGACEVMHFEQELCEKLGVENAILMTSGKAALISALIAMGVGPGDEVIVPAYTYIATAIAVTAVGAIPVIAEVDDSLTLDPDDFEAKISKYTKAVIPVHILGFPCDMDRIMAIAKKHNIMVLEDACQADGGSFRGKRFGTIGDAGAFSFNFFKIITAGEGGAMVTNNRELFERGLIYHDSSAVAYFGDQLNGIQTVPFCGTEFRVSEFTGAIMREQLKKLDPILADLRRNKAYIMDKLSVKYKFARSNDIEGDCGTSIPVRFDTAEEALAFAKKATERGYFTLRPIDSDRHVYITWKSIMEKRGAFNPAFDPFKMEANRDLNHNYSPDMCPKSLDHLSKVAYVSVPDGDQAALDAMVAALLD